MEALHITKVIGIKTSNDCYPFSIAGMKIVGVWSRRKCKFRFYVFDKNGLYGGTD
jgi:hypothetical protein